ncbi:MULTISPECIES: hypothetical protein [Paenibacillus]|uniref:hypothetical protein n=1 Tax=Paenibacillus TaxID=44249 RepID=UPI00119CF2B8|nr:MULTISPECIES: hypothetical protein [Paenibacillus]MCM3491952.1 hypothetical protein [Paenibacillus lactis]
MRHEDPIDKIPHREDFEANQRRGGRHNRHRDDRSHSGREHGRAQTFRRGRALAFLDQLYVKRDTLKRQVNDPDFEAIRQVVSGELKAVDQIIQEYIQAFDLHESQGAEE